MKISKYTFFFDIENTDFYAYNTLSNALIEIDQESYNILHNRIQDEDLSEMLFDNDLWNALVTNNILTDNNEDDFLKYKASIMRMRSQRTGMHLTLAPTMDCCFRCHYCFEKYKEKKYMTPEVMDRITKYVTSCSDLKNIKITWFGGEPLMAVPQIEEFYDKFSAVWKEPVNSNIITTGYHIDKEAVRVMKKVGITFVQITLDGMKKTHNEVKHLASGEDVFERVISNIELLNDLAPEINVTIRVNLTLKNKHEYAELYKFCQNRFGERRNIGLTPAFVLDRSISNCDVCFEKLNIANVSADIVEYIFDNCCFKLNDCMVRNVISYKKKNLLNMFENQPYSTIIKLEYQPLTEYVHENMKEYIEAVVLKKTIIEDEKEDIIDLLRRNLEESDLCASVIRLENFEIEKLADCLEQEIQNKRDKVKVVWNTLLEQNKIGISWENTMLYWKYYSISNYLKKFIEVNVDKLSVEKNNYVTDNFAKDIINYK